MSLGLHPVFDPEIGGWDALGECLFAEFEWIDRVAAAAGVPPLSSFDGWADREVPDGFDGDPDELRAVLGPPIWHRPEDLRKTIAAVRGALHVSEESPERWDRESIDEELAALDRIAAEAELVGARVYLDHS